jgi:predicted DCC family thiol-disulfide oxidoreductase YuxK
MTTSLDDLLHRPGLVVIYDGQCPFCDAYVTMLRLRESVGEVSLIDARTDAALVAELARQGYPLNDGMAALLGGRIYFGADAVTLLSQLTTASGLMNVATAAVLKRPALARVCYPLMRSGRAAALKLMGRPPL